MPLQATSGAASYDGFGGGVAAVPQYIEDVFSTQVYTGTGATNNIVNGVDLATYGGLVWTKARTTTSAFTFAHALIDTLRGAGVQICSDRTDANYTQLNSLTSFNSDGYTLGADTGGQGRVNASIYGTNTYVSWTFRKAPKFFDVVTYTGNGNNRQIAHNLGSVPGCMIIKDCTNAGSAWAVYHVSNGNTKFMQLQDTGAAGTSSGYWNNTTPTSTEFTIGTNGNVNQSGATYIAYLFAHNAGGFGLTGTDNVISCGSYTGTGSVPNNITLGFEPQWLLVKSATYAGQEWGMFDSMRGLVTGSGGDAYLYANSSGAEGSGTYLAATATGFSCEDASARYNNSGDTYIYIAIRRGPMKVPTSGTSVFLPSTVGASNNITVGFPADTAWFRYTGSDNWRCFDRLRSGYELATNLTDAEGTYNYYPTYIDWDSNSVWYQNLQNGPVVDYFFRRAPSFFDEVCYTGNGTAGRTITHNLTVAPELMIVKGRSNAGQWRVYSSALGATQAARLNSTDSFGSNPYAWNNTAPTASIFTVGDDTGVNENTYTYVAYLFATCAGVSKCGTFTGNGSSQTINCGFTGGARFVLIKRVDSTGNWVTFDTARGIVSGNDPALYLNSTAAEVTGVDAIDPDSTGFIVNQESTFNLNVSSATYLVLAIA